MSGRKSLDENFLSTATNPKRKKKLSKVRSLRSLRSSTPSNFSLDFELNSYRGSQVYTDFDIPKTDRLYEKVKENNLVKKFFSRDSKNFKSGQDYRLNGSINYDNKFDQDCKLENFNVNKVIQLQSIIRTLNCKSALLQFGKSKEKIDAQYDAIFDFIDKEKKYVDLLQIIVETYYHALISSKIAILSRDKINTIFFNFEEIYNYHKYFLVLMINQLEKWPNFNISKYLYEHVHNVLVLYENFPANLMNAETTFASVSQKRKFKNFLNQQRRTYQSSYSFPSFRAMISYPSKHISLYEGTCKRMLFNTQINTRTYRLLRDSVAIISAFSKHLQEMIEYNDCQSISTLFGNKRDITARRRQFIGDSLLIAGGSRRMVLLFSDIIVIASKKKRRLKLEEVVPLKDSSLLALRKTADHKRIAFSIQRNFTKQTFDFEEEESRYDISFARAVNDQIKLSNDKVFGVNLNELLDREKSPIPRLIVKAIYYLDKLPNKAGLFRTIGNQSTIMNMRLLESSPKGNDFSICHRDDIAALLAKFLDLLPEPIINYNPIHPVYSTNVYLLSEETIISYLSKAVHFMTENARKLLEYISYFLHRLSSSGFLTTSELSLFFAPLIIRQKDFNHIDYFRAIPNILRIFELLIQKCNEVFVSRDKGRQPESIDEFFNSDSFSGWWKGFRSKDNQLLSFITSEKSINQLLAHLIAIDEYLVDYKSTADQKFQRLYQFSSLSANVFATDWMVGVLFDNSPFLQKFFELFQSAKFELTIKNFVDVIQSFFAHSHSFKIVDYFLSNEHLNYIIIDKIASGNVSTLIGKLIELSNNQHELWKILNILSISAVDRLPQILSVALNNNHEEEAYLNSCKIMNLSQFLSGILYYHDFMSSPLSNGFLHKIHSLFETTDLFRVSLAHSEFCTFICNILIAIVTRKFAHDEGDLNVWNPDNLRDEAVNTQVEKESIDQMKDDLFNQYTEYFPSPTQSRTDEDDNNINHSNSNIINNEIEVTQNNSKTEISPRISQHKTYFFTTIYQVLLTNPDDSFFDLSPTLLSKLISQHEAILLALTADATSTETKLNLLQLIQSLIIVNSPIILNELPHTNILQSMIEIIYQHPHESVLHCVIRDIFHFLLCLKNSAIISFIINDTPFITKLIYHPIDLKRKKNINAVVLFYGHSLKLKTAIEENDTAMKVIREDSQFKDNWSSQVKKAYQVR